MFLRFLAISSLLLMGLASQAATYGQFCNRNGYITEYMCGAYPSGPGWVQGQDGCWYLATTRPCSEQPPPYPSPNPPPYPPPYPPQNRYVHCESYGYGYNECYLGPQVRRVTLTRQWSREACIAYQTFGATTDRMWVTRGCRGDFFVEYY
jgi:hypothetical protein